MFARVVTVMIGLFAFGPQALAAELRLGLLTPGGAMRSVYADIIADFEAATPGVSVRVTALGDEDYKKMLPEWLAEPPGAGVDVLNWQAGERLARFARDGRIAPLDALWAEARLDDAFSPAMKSAVSYDGAVYGVPVSYYQWGFYYRKSVFDEVGVAPPGTWSAFLDACAKFQAAGKAWITVGSVNRWPLAAWFDYLNLRINGLDFHRALLGGAQGFDDDRVRAVFAEWAKLRDSGCFIEGHETRDWKEALPFLYRGRAGVMLMGNFATPEFTTRLRDDIGFFAFPAVDAAMPRFEDAPTDLFMLAANAAQPEAGARLLAFLARPDVQERISAASGTIPPHREAKASDDRFIQAGKTLLAQADGIAQFFDRDANASVAAAGLEAFADFMAGAAVDDVIAKMDSGRPAPPR